MFILVATWGLGIALNVLVGEMEKPTFTPSMEYGETYCPAPTPAKTNKEFGEKVMALAACKREGLCLSSDGSKCVEPIIWGDKNAQPNLSFSRDRFHNDSL